MTTYLDLKLRRFEGRDPHPNHIGKCGCQGYVDDKGNKYECPFKEALASAKRTFESTLRLGRNTEMDSKYGFLTMYVLDHDDCKKKTFKFASKGISSDNTKKTFVEEMNGATLRCRGCDRFKSIMCGDNVSAIHESATSVWVTQEDDMEDPALIITIDDDFNNIMQNTCLGRWLYLSLSCYRVFSNAASAFDPSVPNTCHSSSSHSSGRGAWHKYLLRGVPFCDMIAWQSVPSSCQKRG